MKRVRYYLKLTTWAGYDLTAKHYYASIRWSDEEDDYHYERMTHEIQDECIFCKGKKCEYCDQKGWVPYNTERFDSKAEAINFSTEWFKKNAPRGAVLLEGDAAYAEPIRMIAGADRVLRAANKVWKKADAHWQKHGPHGKVWDKLCREWERILR